MTKINFARKYRLQLENLEASHRNVDGGFPWCNFW